MLSVRGLNPLADAVDCSAPSRYKRHVLPSKVAAAWCHAESQMQVVPTTG